MISDRRLPVILSLMGALAWGIWWLPIRQLEAAGLTGVWAGMAMNVFMLLAVLLSMAVRRTNFHLPPYVWLGGLFVGLAVTLYATSITKTDVVRAVLLFYLAPAWSLMIECWFMERRFRRANAMALLAAFVGLLLIFRGDLSVHGWGIGDLMAIGSGIAWSIGAALIFANQGRQPAGHQLSARALALATTIGAIITAGVILAFDPATSRFEPISWHKAILLSFLGGAVYLAPIIVATMWGAIRLPPATISFLLTAEIISGVASAAIFLDERFGLPEAAGAFLIATAAVMEVLMPQRHQVSLG